MCFLSYECQCEGASADICLCRDAVEPSLLGRTHMPANALHDITVPSLPYQQILCPTQ